MKTKLPLLLLMSIFACLLLITCTDDFEPPLIEPPQSGYERMAGKWLADSFIYNGVNSAIDTSITYWFFEDSTIGRIYISTGYNSTRGPLPYEVIDNQFTMFYLNGPIKKSLNILTINDSVLEMQNSEGYELFHRIE